MSASACQWQERKAQTRRGHRRQSGAPSSRRGSGPLESLQRILDSGLGEADAHVHAQAASRISEIMTPSTARTTRLPAARSLWSRAGDIANSLLARVRFDSKPGGGLSEANDLPDRLPYSPGDRASRNPRLLLRK